MVTESVKRGGSRRSAAPRLGQDVDRGVGLSGRRLRTGRALARSAAALLVTAALLTGCAQTVAGTGSIGLVVRGDSGSAFDTQARTALSAILAFWSRSYPTVSGGAALPPLRGSLYSVDGAAVVRTGQAPLSASAESCLQQRVGFIVDNAAYCQLDDSIIWDRAPGHLLPVLAAAYGPAVTALVFAHEFGHAIQYRLHLTALASEPTIDVESQADCAAGAFAGAALQGRIPGFALTPAALDQAFVGYLQIRDTTPSSPQDVSHGDGFDRLNALQQGIENGARFCFSPAFLHNRTFTERGYVNDNDYIGGGNQPLDAVLAPDQLVTDLNRFWTTEAKALGKSFDPVTLRRADHPACGAASASEFGYCPNDNSVYYSYPFARQAYYSITAPVVDPGTGAVRLARDQPGDFALGTLMATGWGMAVRHQLFAADTTSREALTVAVCYAGAYAEDVNRADYDATHRYILSPPDMDEATSAVLSLIGLDRAFGARGTTALQRVRAFVAGYTGGVAAC